MKLICSLGHCGCDGHTEHKLSQPRLTADWLGPRKSDYSRMRSKVSSDWLPSYIKATRPVLEIFKMDGYFSDSPRIFCCSLVTTDAFTIGRSHMQGVHPDLRYKDIYSNITNCDSGQPRLPVTLHTHLKLHRPLFLLGYEHQYSNCLPVSNRIWSILLCVSIAMMHLILRTEILNNNNNNRYTWKNHQRSICT
jgi:hypothetical protein